MSTDSRPRPTQALTRAQPDKSVFHDGAEETHDRAILAGAHTDHTLSDAVAARTESPLEAEIDRRNGLRGAPGRTPQEEDFADVLTPEGNSGNVHGADVDESVWEFGETGSTRGTEW